MCGIAGYFGEGDEKILSGMTDAINYRGPDDKGLFIEKNIGLGHRRLSIIDLTPSGHQPMSNEDNTIWIVFNGEIYNYKELRKELQHQHSFVGQSDTEVLVHLYEEIGLEIFKKLNGMFAIAIYDKRNSKLVLARDRMGKKPLFWAKYNNSFIFGSELKSLMKYPKFKKELDLESLNKYLQFEYIPTPHTIFKDVYKLEPSSYLVFDGKDISKNFYWDLSETFREKEVSFSQAKSSLDTLMNDAVTRRMVSDVPLGIFLSGGIDSSAIAYYAQKNSSQKVKTFSIGFKEESFDESNYARTVAKFLGTDHHEKILSAKDCISLFPEIISQLDEPMADPSLVPTYLLSKFTREHVTVALGGDGGDELFCGYDPFIAHKLSEYYEKIPKAIRKGLIESVIKLLPTSHKNISFDFKVKSFVSGFEGEKKYRDFRWMGSFGREERSALFTRETWCKIEQKNEYVDIDGYLTKLGKNNYYNQLIFLYLRMYLMDDILVKVDRASMFNSLEVRAPMLDFNVVNFSNSLPMNYKFKGLTTKYILKKTMEGKIPDKIIYRKKKGFGLPIAEWISGDLKPLVMDLLDEKKINQQNIFNYDYIKKLLNDHFSFKKDNRKKIWTLMVFQMWYNHWFK